MDRPAGYYWVRFDGDEYRWHIAYHNQYGWTLSTEFSQPKHGWTSNELADKKFVQIVGPIEEPNN